LEAIKMLTARYGCEAILMSATMPNFDVWLSEFKCSGLSTQNLIDDDSCFAAFDRCRIENLGKIDDETLLRRADEGRNALIVVNTRKKAKQLYELYAGQKYHLSTYMTHADRERTIEKVKAALAGGEHFCLFSTSLIEAGVDLDFDVVFREMAGLESLLQTAGRCNRSGLKDRNFCVAYSFESEEKTPPDLAKKVYYTQEAFKNFERIDSQKAIGEYFDRLYKDEKANMSRLDFVNAAGADGSSPSERYRFFSPERVRSADLRSITPFNFAGYAQTFRMIDENTRPLVIVNGGNRAEVKALFAALKNGASGKSVGRKLQKYVVALRSYEWAALEKLGVIETCEGFDRLANENYYNENTGLSLEDANDYIV
jgi:CRISPR-associated endonuclease/helicase Cas3